MLFQPVFRLILICFFSNSITAHSCYYCVSYAHFLAPNLRYQLGAQTDIFHWPVDASLSSCSKLSLATDSHQPLAQICSKFSLCVTLSPNAANTSFVVRGCMEQILVAKLRVDEKFQKEGCHVVHSKQIYQTLAPLEYVICVCSTEYCNSVQNPFVRRNHSEPELSDLQPAIKRVTKGVAAEVRNLAAISNSLLALVSISYSISTVSL